MQESALFSRHFSADSSCRSWTVSIFAFGAGGVAAGVVELDDAEEFGEVDGPVGGIGVVVAGMGCAGVVGVLAGVTQPARQTTGSGPGSLQTLPPHAWRPRVLPSANPVDHSPLPRNPAKLARESYRAQRLSFLKTHPALVRACVERHLMMRKCRS